MSSENTVKGKSKPLKLWKDFCEKADYSSDGFGNLDNHMGIEELCCAKGEDMITDFSTYLFNHISVTTNDNYMTNTTLQYMGRLMQTAYDTIDVYFSRKMKKIGAKHVILDHDAKLVFIKYIKNIF